MDETEAFREAIETVGNVGARLLVTVLLVGLPFIWVSLGTTVWRRLVDADIRAVPLITRLAVGAAILAAPALIRASDRGWMFRPSWVLEEPGPWTLGWVDFLTLRADPALYGWEAALARAENYLEHPWFAVYLAGPIILLILAVLAAARMFEPNRAFKAIVATLVCNAWATILSLYVLALMAYAVHWLNIWAAAVALVLLQVYRSRAH